MKRTKEMHEIDNDINTFVFIPKPKENSIALTAFITLQNTCDYTVYTVSKYFLSYCVISQVC